MSKVTFQQVIDFLGLAGDQAQALLDALEEKYPDGAASIAQIQAVVAQHVTPENLSTRIVEGLMEGWNTLRAGKGPARVNPTSHFV
jgi:hypothetical protein